MTTQLSTVAFCRKTRQYIVKNGRVIGAFPAGPENKVKAQWLAIAHDAPAVADIARSLMSEYSHIEGIEARIIHAARLVIEGRITEFESDGYYVRAIVQASEGNRSPVTGWPFYQVHYNLVWTCDCPDRHFNHAEPCAHPLAVEIHRRLEAERSEVAARKLQDWTDAAAARQTAQGEQTADQEPDILDLIEYDDASETATERAARWERTGWKRGNGGGSAPVSVPADAPLTLRERHELDELRREQADEKPWYLRADPANRRGQAGGWQFTGHRYGS